MNCFPDRVIVEIAKDPSQLAIIASAVFMQKCAEAIEKRGAAYIAVSGGKTPELFFRQLVLDGFPDKFEKGKVFVFWVDERTVPSTHPDSNYGMCRKYLPDPEGKINFFPMKGDMNADKAAQEYENLIRQTIPRPKNSLPRFDLVVLGLGEDGHTASLFPNTPALTEWEKLVVANPVPKMNTTRITLTLPTLNNARCCIFMVQGKNKFSPLALALDLLGKAVIPAQLVKPSNGEDIWIADKAAIQG